MKYTPHINFLATGTINKLKGSKNGGGLFNNAKECFCGLSLAQMALGLNEAKRWAIREVLSIFFASFFNSPMVGSESFNVVS